MDKKINSALISVFYKDNLEPIIQELKDLGVTIYSTGGTQKFIEDLGGIVTPVEDLTGYPSIFGGRVKTLHPKVFGGILHRRSNSNDVQEANEYAIPPIDLVIVDLYPFEETVDSGASEEDIIEKIDIGGIALIRGAAKNFEDVVIISNKDQYGELSQLIKSQKGSTTLEQRKKFATEAFATSSHYDSKIFEYFNQEFKTQYFKQSYKSGKQLRYGENPHQEGVFYGDFDKMFDKLHGKEISYNNLIDIDAAVSLIKDFEETTFAILKHNNACGIASSESVKDAYLKAFEADTLSAFGGILVTNKPIDLTAAKEINKLFCEVVIAPDFELEALELLKSKKNRILLKQKESNSAVIQYRSLLNGVIEQDRDLKTETINDLNFVTNRKPTESEVDALLFANKIVKHTKSNAIVIAKKGQMISSGVGQTSRVDAVQQAIAKGKHFGFKLSEGVLASDAFFPFSDSVELANKEGIKAIIQPGGSVRDQETIDFCNENGIAMVFTGYRHFKH